MRKIFLSTVMVIGFCVFCNAQTAQTVQTDAAGVKAVVTTSTDEGYKEVKMEELTPVIQEAIKSNYAGLQVKTLAYNEEKKLTKVTFVAPNGEEKVVILNEEGKEQQE